jgi:carboxypeptidase Q
MYLALLYFTLTVWAQPFPPSPQMFSDANAIIAAAQAGSTAWSRLAEATDTFGGRLSGSQSLNSFISWAAAQATADGLTVTLEPVVVPHWVRGEEWAQLELPRSKRLHFCGAGYSNNTGGAPITAPVLVVGSFAELQNRSAEARGKICLFDWETWEGYGATVSYRYNAATWGASVGCVGALFKAITYFGLQTCHTGVSAPGPIASGAVSHEDSLQMRRMQARGQSVVVTMCALHIPPHLHRAGAPLTQKKSASSPPPPPPLLTDMEAAMAAPVTSWNLIMDYTHPGAAFPDELVIVSGHMDSWDLGEGAMDDGGGFVTAWEAVRLLAALKIFTNRTVRAIGWVDEESGGVGAVQCKLTRASAIERAMTQHPTPKT